MLNDDAYRTGIADTFMCDCGQEKETVQHVLLRCTRYVEARNTMKAYLSDICDNLTLKSRRKRKIEINESLLLTPFNFMNNTDVHRKEDNYIKEALIEFLSGVDRRIWHTQKLSYFLLFHHQCWRLLLIYSSLHSCWFSQFGTRLQLAIDDQQQQHYKVSMRLPEKKLEELSRRW